ncbi:hypothetical protein CGLAU_04235 [Corynebacterium glaucum]|uniref:Phytase-like domain-containing protein n=1 Tax=Corynebacterium glaucum TaxID=187491 RepID=A0A1Q2HVG6_9CORY|nr:esterase-like activity of phytase family protein [Corynebacterium glaucum]AQQ14822.1 hypothetical protein CGLAU_04235 [Corynebacterium glaucum]
MKLPPQLQHFLNSPQFQQVLAVIVGLLVATGLFGAFIGGGSSNPDGSSNNGSNSGGNGTVTATASATPSASASSSAPEPKASNAVLEARAKLSATYLAEGPNSGKDTDPKNGQNPPYDGQVIPGFSGVQEIGDGTFYGLPDNGFGAKGNSSDFLLRIYTVKPTWETADNAANPEKVGGIEVLNFIQLKDPNNEIQWDIVNKDDANRPLTGADFDLESFWVAEDGTFWIGEEFGPYILHFAKDGTLLEAPYAHPSVKSPSNPTLGSETANLRNSKGFEAMASDGRYLYPIFEGYIDDAQNKKARVISQFDMQTQQYTDKSWTYLTEDDDSLIGDAFLTKDGTLLVLERDDALGAEAKLKKIYAVKNFGDSTPAGELKKEEHADLLRIANPGKIGMVSDKGAYGVADPFSFALRSVETIIQLEDGRYLTALDNNFPGDDGRYSGKPDDTEIIIFSVK